MYGNLISMISARKDWAQRAARAAGMSESELIAGACGHRVLTTPQRAAIAKALGFAERDVFDPFAEVPGTSGRSAPERAVACPARR